MILVCENCEISYNKPLSHVRVGRQFCTRVCYTNWYKNNPGTWVDIVSGYRYIWLDGKQIFEHRHLMQNHIGRKLEKNEVVHHIDGNKLNNTLSNLQLMTKKEHTLFHNLNKEPFTSKRLPISDETRKKMSDSHKKRWQDRRKI